MSDWVQIEVQEFMQCARENTLLKELVGRIVLDRLPFTFDTKQQYFHWRAILAEGLEVDSRDIVIVGSAATGRSLSPRKKFGIFDAKYSLRQRHSQNLAAFGVLSGPQAAADSLL